MYVTVHVPLGTAIGVATGNVWLAGIISLLSHFIIDRIPHWQFLHTDKLTFKSGLTVALDIAIALAVGLWILGQVPAELKAPVFVGGFFSAIPDLDIALAGLWPKLKKLKWFAAYRKWHDKLQCEPGKLWAIWTQVAVIIFSFIIIAAFASVS